MFCRNCGQEVMDKAEVCIQCGVRPLAERKYCQECGNETTENQEICIKCGCRLRTSATASSSGKPLTLNTAGLPLYYEVEFRKIWEGEEAYKGKWNWAAFLFGPIWALTKGAWLSGLVGIVLCCFTMGIYCFVFGFRGNWMFYNVHAKSKHIVA